MSFFVYLAICSIWPTKNQILIKEMGLTWEAQSGNEIIAEDGTIIIEEGKVPRERSENSDQGELQGVDFGLQKSETHGMEKNF